MSSAARPPPTAAAKTLHITPAGAAIRQSAWPVYAAAIQEAVGARLADGEAEQLARLLQRLSAEPGGRDAGPV